MKKQVKKVALYVRVSTAMQADRDSLPLQRSDLSNYSKFILGTENFVIFEDAGYSAKNTIRPAYQDMMARIKAGEFSHLLVWKIDRISRNLLDFAEMYKTLKELGVTFISRNEQFDTSTAMGEAMLKIILVFAELERNMTSERVTAVMIDRAKNGMYNGSAIPIGYNYDKSTKIYSLNNNEAEIVKLIYDKYTNEDMTSSQICRYLNYKNIPTKKHNQWNTASVCRVLRNPFYKGTLRWNRKAISKGGKAKPKNEWIMIEDHHIPIVDSDKWLQAQIKMDLSLESRNIKGRKVTKKYIHIFSSLLHCYKCGSFMMAGKDKMRKNGYRPSRYYCPNSDFIDGKSCPNKYIISDMTAGTFVFNLIAKILKAQNNISNIKSPKQLEQLLLENNISKAIGIDSAGLNDLYYALQETSGIKLLRRSNKVYKNNNVVEINILEAEKQKLYRANDKLRSLYLYSSESMSEQEYMQEKLKIEQKLEDVEKRINESINASSDIPISNAQFLQNAAEFIVSKRLISSDNVDFVELAMMDEKLLKDFVNTIIKSISVFYNKIIEIEFRNGITLKFNYENVNEIPETSIKFGRLSRKK